jgi:hypothetical protein
LRLHRQLTETAQEWEALNREPDVLYRGARLTQAQEWARENAEEMNQLEREFVDASGSLAQHEVEEREAQRQRELEAAQKLAQSEKQRAEEQSNFARQMGKRARYLMGAFIVALVMVFTALYFGSRARTAAITAQNEERLALARELAASSLNNLDVDPERSILLAMQAISTTKTVDGTVLREAEEALHQAILASRVQLTLKGHERYRMVGCFQPG